MSETQEGNGSKITVLPENSFLVGMPYPGTPGTPYFDGQNVTDFLNRFSDLCADYKLPNTERIKKLPRYCDVQIGQLIEATREWKDRNWEGLRKLLREEYERHSVSKVTRATRGAGQK